ncbi:MAG: zinc ribbon domain-containing protein [Desulfuromonadales bacterium]|nr:zinc ribbon domain-containing protein [Desulfuromonadales bacterium]
MPLYEYQCESCGLQFEVRQKFSDKQLTACKECGGEVKKLISQGGFALKGSGWYQQGYSPQSGCSAPKGDGCSDCPKAANG